MSATIFRASCAFAGLLTLAACGQSEAPAINQYGANPDLPAPQQ